MSSETDMLSGIIQDIYSDVFVQYKKYHRYPAAMPTNDKDTIDAIVKELIDIGARAARDIMCDGTESYGLQSAINGLVTYFRRSPLEHAWIEHSWLMLLNSLELWAKREENHAKETKS